MEMVCGMDTVVMMCDGIAFVAVEVIGIGKVVMFGNESVVVTAVVIMAVCLVEFGVDIAVMALAGAVVVTGAVTAVVIKASAAAHGVVDTVKETERTVPGTEQLAVE